MRKHDKYYGRQKPPKPKEVKPDASKFVNTTDGLGDMPMEVFAFKLQQFYGSAQMNRMIEKYPEWFPEEVEHRRKWALVPEEVKDAHVKEWMVAYNEATGAIPAGGIMAHIMDSEYSRNWHQKYSEAMEKLKPIEKAIHEKHYGKYGL